MSTSPAVTPESQKDSHQTIPGVSVGDARRPTAIRVHALNKAYVNRSTGQSVAALVDVNLDIAHGEFVSIVGASGCGKSTLLRIISGLIPASSGTVEVEGKPVAGPVPGIAFVFQKPVLLPWKTALENVVLPAKIKRTADRSAWDKAADLLALVGLQASERRYPHELSGGMQQRVALARSLFLDSEIILMDEPFGAVDALTRERLNVDVSEIMHRAGRTTVLVTHSISEAAFLSDRVLAMSSSPGRVVASTEVDAPQPRPLESMTDPNVLETTVKIRQLLIGAK